MRRHIDRHLNTLKEKPHHVRERFAFGLAGGVTALVAIIWAVSLAGGGTLALTGPEVNDEATEAARSSVSELLGAVGARSGASSSDPNLRIVDGETTTTLTAPPQSQNAASATAIPF
ncbi:MAG TPA: hypothetical protein VF696_01300 [Candidatus Paceibacterota bacterium]|jgi:hypothetical protein